MSVRDYELEDAPRVRIPWFFRRYPHSDMHHVEVISRLEGERVDQLEELIAAAEAVDQHEPLGEHKFLRMKHGEDDLAVGFMAYEAGRLVGYAHTLIYGSGGERRISCELVVHPAYRRGGVGAALMEYIVQHAEAEDAHRLDIWSYNDSEASRHFAQSLQLEESRRLLHMHRHPGPPPIVVAPEDATLRAFRPGTDDEAVLALNNRIFEEHPENGTWTLADFHARTSQLWFRAEDLLILEVGRKMAGFCWAKVEERGDEGMVGEIYVIGTAPEYHGRGLGRYLLGEALRHLSGRSVKAVAVYVDQSNERAVALYWSFEFHHHHADVLYSMPLPVSAESRAAAAAG